MIEKIDLYNPVPQNSVTSTEQNKVIYRRTIGENEIIEKLNEVIERVKIIDEDIDILDGMIDKA